ncbi:hypothetical protein [Saccharibacillus sacchari]|uniref:hypothetical protein n=1 Tax=Saccharibacillus sacchari TaxID=456493 RepID=UPI0012EC461F|nr:hypothetical protein [Saccharibacillus sacchari]
MNIFLIIWNFTIKPIPIILALLIYFIPLYWMKYKRDIYTPIYFAVYPLANLNISLSQYLGESIVDDYIDDEVVEREKKIIRIKSMLFSIFYVMILPFILALIWTFFLDNNQFLLATLILFGIILFKFIKSITHFRDFVMSSRRGILIFFYTVVSFAFFYILYRTHLWVSPLIENKEYESIITTIGDFLILNVILTFLIIGIAIPITISLVFDNRVRRAKHEEHQTVQESDSAFVVSQSNYEEGSSTDSDHSRGI